MDFTRKIYDNARSDSLAARMRRKRFTFFLQLLNAVPRPLTILDVGGRQRFWEVMGFAQEPDVHITLLNIEPAKIHYDNFLAMTGDATCMDNFLDNQFDVVFSNSVIEHVGSFEQQKQMAREVRRVARRYFIQTPNYYFPIEPHFLFIGFHWLPLKARAWLHSQFNLGWRKRIPDRQLAQESVAQVRLLRKKELLSLFPHCRLYEEKIMGLTKSLIVYGGWGEATRQMESE
jgi:2-polyprenyl-3-methyl-5-hydroxy-6-metoxy-1,4-benzoquinol methylase